MRNLLKTSIVLTTLLGSASALAQPPKQTEADKYFKSLSNFLYDQYLGLPSGPLEFQLSPPPKLDQNAVKKCSPEPDKMMAYLKGLNYIPLFVALDQSRPELQHQHLFNKDDGSVLEITLVRDRPVIGDDAKDAGIKDVKLCLEWTATGSFGNGEAFKAYILRQRMDIVEAALADALKEQQKHDEENNLPGKNDGRGDNP